MCKSLGHQPLQGRCPAPSLNLNHKLLQQGTRTADHLMLLRLFFLSSSGFLKDCFGGFDHHRQLHLVLDSLEEIADIESNGGKREDEEEEEPFR